MSSPLAKPPSALTSVPVWSITGSNAGIFQHANLAPDPLTGSGSVRKPRPNFKAGSPTQIALNNPNPKTLLHPVQYELTVGTPKGRCSLVPGLGIQTRRAGCGWY